MNFRALISGLALVLVSCGKPPEPKPAATPTPAPTPAPTATPKPTPTPFVADTSSQVSVLGYHRFEKKPHDPLAITPEHFRKQMEAVRDSGIPVIPMADLLAWRRGEKNIPPKAIVITIDDGYNDAYSEAWPILKEFGYPFTYYVYINYIGAGGRSIKWDQLKEMSAAGVDIASHTVSHDSLIRPKAKSLAGRSYDDWLANELQASKASIEEHLGTHVTTIAYPFGIHNDNVAAKALAAGYEAAFTVNGQKALYGSPAAKIGRYIVQSDKEFTFANALKFGGSSGGIPGVADANPAAASMLTEPMQGETVTNPKPTMKVNLATFGAVDPKTVEMRISGFGLVPSTYDPATQLLTYTMHQRLREKDVTVLVSARAAGKKASASWTFHFDPSATPAPPAASSTPAPASPGAAPFDPSATPKDEAGIPPMVPAQ